MIVQVKWKVCEKLAFLTNISLYLENSHAICRMRVSGLLWHCFSPETVLILRLKSEKNETVEEFIEPNVFRAIGWKGEIEGGLHIWQTSGWLPAQLQHRLHEPKSSSTKQRACVWQWHHTSVASRTAMGPKLGCPDACHGTSTQPNWFLGDRDACRCKGPRHQIIEYLMSGYALRGEFACQTVKSARIHLGATTASVRNTQINAKTQTNSNADGLIIQTETTGRNR